jgi:hypothetical protein
MASGKHTLQAVALYLAVVWVLYGRREVLPKSVIKALDTDELLKADKRDPKELVYYNAEVGKLLAGKSAKTLYDLSEKLKAEKK